MATISAEAFRLLMENIADRFFVHDVEGRLLDVNARASADLGYDRDELLGLTVADISLGQPSVINAGKWRDMPAGTALRFAEVVLRKDGSTFPVEISLTCQIIEGRKLFIGLARDLPAQDGGEPVWRMR